ncbi:MAG TPA: hypothetical protein VGN60_13410 [Devosia sp.]|nr:hypothetical protein [Devosia sp.]
MPKYFFDIIENGHLTVDHEGYELKDRHHAHREAVKTIAAMAAEEIPKDGDMKLTVAVADDRHHILFKTHVRFEPGGSSEDE